MSYLPSSVSSSSRRDKPFAFSFKYLALKKYFWAFIAKYLVSLVLSLLLMWSFGLTHLLSLLLLLLLMLLLSLGLFALWQGGEVSGLCCCLLLLTWDIVCNATLGVNYFSHTKFLLQIWPNNAYSIVPAWIIVQWKISGRIEHIWLIEVLRWNRN